jgi:heme/copper-type cytochrome/quinol oxidase subunit 1
MVVSHPLSAFLVLPGFFLVLPGSHVVPVITRRRLWGRCIRRVRWA